MSRPRIDRRAFLAALASASALAACSGGRSLLPTAVEQQPEGRFPHATTVSTTFTNKSSHANSKIVYYVVGQNPAAGNAWYCLNSSGKLVALPSSGAPALKLAKSGSTKLALPALISGRVYFAINGKLKIPLNGGGPAWPAGWTPSDPSYKVLFDWFEYTWTGPGNTFTCNTTQVDMFGLPLLLQCNPTSKNNPGVSHVGVANGDRTKIFNAIKSTKPFSKLVVGGGNTPLRVIAPGHGIENGDGFSSSYLNDYINSVWSTYASKTITLDTNGYGTYKGNVSGTNFTFVQAGSPNVVIAKPSTLQAFECDGPLSSADPATARIGAELAAGLNRGTLLLAPNSQPNFNKSKFYKASPTNLYSKIMHKYNAGGYAYGFADDDQGSFSSTLANAKISSFTVTLSSF